MTEKVEAGLEMASTTAVIQGHTLGHRLACVEPLSVGCEQT